MRLILHIGTEKTGTTAFQVWMHENTPQLRAQGVWYAQPLGLPNHRGLSVACRNSDQVEDGFRHFGIHSPADHAAFRERTFAALRADVAAARAEGAHTYVISSEHCHSRMKFQDMVDRAADLLCPLFASVEVVCFLRPQVDLALSLASTTSRCGLHVSRRVYKGVGHGNSYYKYPDLLARWASAFGRDAILPVAFARNPSPVDWLMGHLGLDPAAEYIPARRVNQTLDYRVVAMMNALVGPDNTGPISTVHPMHRRIMADELPCEIPLSFARADAMAVHEKFAPLNAELVAAWPDHLLPEDMEPDWERYPETGTIDLLDGADFGPFLQRIIGRLNADLSMARARTCLMESREAEHKGNIAESIAHMSPALGHLQDASAVGFMESWATTQTGHYQQRLDRLHSLSAPAPEEAPAPVLSGASEIAVARKARPRPAASLRRAVRRWFAPRSARAGASGSKAPKIGPAGPA